MKLKTKMIASIMSICLVCAVFAISVFALKTANLKISGDVTFNANGIVADVEFVSLTGHDATNSTLNTFEKVTLDNNTPGSAVQAKMATWQNLDIEFAETGADVVLTFKITNKMDDKLSVNISSNYASSLNSNAKIEISEQVSAIAANDATPKQYTVTFKIGNTELDAALEDFDININLVKGEATVATINEVKVGDTAVTSYAGQELKANALSLTHFAGTQNVSIPASGQVAIKTNLTAKTPNFAKVNLAYNDMSTVQPKLLIRGTSLFLDDSKDSQNYYIYLINTDKTNAISNLSLADLGLSLTIDNSNSFDELVQYDSTNSYYYVEMGTMPNETNTGSEYIKWRYISEDGQTKFINEEQPFSLKGTYILETDVQHLTNCAVNNPDCINNSKTLRNDDVANNMLLSVSYQNSYIKNWDNVTGYLTGENSSINANDYALSTIRQYINGTNVAKATSDTTSWKGFETITPKETSQNSNMLIDLCINADEDVVYNKISARSLKDLYSDMGEGLDNINYLTDTAYALGAGKVSNADTLTEKFWIPSFAEVKNLLATSDSYAPYQSEDAGADWNTSNMHGYYWLRSPRAVHSSDAYFVYYGGNCYYQSVNVYYCAARACFNLG